MRLTDHECSKRTLLCLERDMMALGIAHSKPKRLKHDHENFFLARLVELLPK